MDYNRLERLPETDRVKTCCENATLQRITGMYICFLPFIHRQKETVIPFQTKYIYLSILFKMIFEGKIKVYPEPEG